MHVAADVGVSITAFSVVVVEVVFPEVEVPVLVAVVLVLQHPGQHLHQKQ